MRDQRSNRPSRARSVATLLAVLFLALAAIPRDASGAEGGTIVGSVYFRGTPPPPKRLPIDKDNDICGTGFREIVEVNVGPDETLRDIVVSVKGGATGLRFEKPEDGFKMNQKGCRFVPELFIVPAGEKLQITNRDQLVHNIHTYEIIKGRRRDMFNFAQPERGHRRTEIIKPRRSNTVELTCDVHSFMHGWIYVSDGGDCEVSKDGRFRITEVPDGVYSVTIWHPILGEQTVEVTMEGAQDVSVEVEYHGAEQVQVEARSGDDSAG